jgi:hypothetical protein
MKKIAVADIINALVMVKKIRGGVNRIPRKFTVTIGIGHRQTIFPVETRSVKISNRNYKKVMGIELVF